MSPTEMEELIRNIDTRLQRVEQILPTLATKAELREEVRTEGERTRRHFDAVAERLESQIRLVAEGQIMLAERMDNRFARVEARLGGLEHLELRVTRLENERQR